ncbi:MAG: hypothetical protein SFV32_11935 [Opitutaceae bacterium]|nr:hypothetical protein [Opitutaceae bacterium]
MQKLWLAGSFLLFPCLGLGQTETPAPAPAAPPAVNAGSWFYSGPMMLDDLVEPIFWKGIGIQPYVSHRISHSSGRPSEQSSRGKTTINRFSPGVAISVGPNWTATYSPSWTWYTADAYDDSLNHAVSLQGRLPLGRGEAAVRQSYSKSSEALVETARQTDQESWNTSVSYGAPLTTRLGYTLEGTQDIRSTQAFTDTRDYTATASLRYQLTPLLRAGIGATWGYTDTDPGANTRWQRLQATLSWTPGSRLALSASFGLERRELLTHPPSESEGPTYGLNAQYQVTETTTLIAGANRGFNSSFFASSFVETESIYAGLSQRLLGFLTLSARYREGKSSYEGTGAIAAREDDTNSTTLDLSAPVGSRTSVSLFYQNTENKTSTDEFAFDTEEFGASVSYRF